MTPQFMERALSAAGADAMEANQVFDAIRDWVDRDDNPAPGGSGAESE